MEGKIKNFDDLAASPARKAVLMMAEAGLAAIDTQRTIRERVKLSGNEFAVDEESLDISEFERLFVVGIGKCALEAGAALEDVLGDRLSGGIVLDVHQGSLQKIKAYSGTHPYPTEANVDATSAIIRLLSSLGEKDLVIFIISGGGSTLLCQPENMVCAQEADILKVLFDKGATIEEINILRKHLSLARGGRLAEYAHPASSVALIFSDVPGDDLGFVASGPTVKDETTVEEARAIVQKYALEKETGLKIEPLKTPKEDKYFAKVKNILFISNKTALFAVAEAAKKMGFRPEIKTSLLSGEAREAGERIAEDISGADPNTAYFYAGETTVTVANPQGRGGRNQELALGALRAVANDCVVLSLASDGKDNGEYGGALCDKITREKAVALDLKGDDFLARNDSSEFFEMVGGALLTGDTGSNVSDIVIAIKT